MLRRCLAGLAWGAGILPALAHQPPHTHGHTSAPVPNHPAAAVSITECWIRAMPARLPSGGYFVVHNHSAYALQLTGVSSPAFGHSMLHQTVTRHGMAHMQHINTIDIPAHTRLEFVPGGHHIMLEQPTTALVPGQSVSIQLHFGAAGSVSSDCLVRSPASLGAH